MHRGKDDGKVFTSLDCINIEKQLGYTYGPGSLDDHALTPALENVASAKAIRVSGLNRAAIRGSFLISAFASVGGKKLHVGTEAVLSRWNVRGCANCQTHLETKAVINLRGLADSAFANARFAVEVHTRDGILSSALAQEVGGSKRFRVEVR